MTGRSRSESRTSDSKLAVKNKAAKAKKPPVKKAKAVKDPNKPKRPPSAFFVFMEDFRKEFKAENPHNKAVSAVGKAGGEKWKKLSEAEKVPYVTEAEKRKAQYEKTMQAYNKKQAAGADDEESDKSKSEVNDDDDDEDGSGDDDEDDDDDE